MDNSLSPLRLVATLLSLMFMALTFFAILGSSSSIEERAEILPHWEPEPMKEVTVITDSGRKYGPWDVTSPITYHDSQHISFYLTNKDRVNISGGFVLVIEPHQEPAK